MKINKTDSFALACEGYLGKESRIQTMRLKVRMFGVLQEIKGSKEAFMDIPKKSTVGSVIKKIVNNNENLKKILWDNQVNSPSPNALIILDGVEINNLRGMDTQIKPNQELVFLSVVHGG